MVIEAPLMLSSSRVFRQIPSLLSQRHSIVITYVTCYGKLRCFSRNIYCILREKVFRELFLSVNSAYIHTISKDIAILMSKLQQF